MNVKSLLTSVALFFLANSLLAQTSNWTGAVDSSWNTVANWDNGIPNVSSETAVVGSPSPTVADVNVTLGGLSVLTDGVLTIPAGRSFNFDSAASITNEGQINLEPNVDFQLANIVINDGTISVDGSGPDADIELLVDSTLDGGGELVLGGSDARVNDAGGLQTLTNGTNHTIRGEGDIGVNTISIINNGLVTADVSSGTLLLDPSNSGVLTNNGTLQAENGGILRFGDGVFENANGLIQTSAGQVRFATGAVVNGGEITGSDIFVESSANTEFNDTTFSGSVNVSVNTDFRVSGLITNNATITLDGSGSPTDLELSAATTLAGSGTLVLDGAGARVNDAGGVQTLTNSASHTIRGSGDLGNNSIDIVNEGIVTADIPTQTMVINPNSSAGTVTNNGTLRAENGGTLRFGDGIFNNSGGLIESAGGQIFFVNGATVNGGNINGGDILVETGDNVEFIDTTFNGSVTVLTNTDFRITNTVTNNGTITLDGSGSPTDLELFADATLAGTGTLFLDGANARVNDAGGTQEFTNAAGHTISGDGGQIGVNTISIVNDGVIVADGISNGTPLTIDPAGGATTSSFSGNGTVRAINGSTVLLQPAGYLFGNGTFEAIGSGSTIERSTSTFTVDFGSVRAIDGATVRISDSGTADADLNSNTGLIELRGNSYTDVFNDTPIITLSNGQTESSPASNFGGGGSRNFTANSGTFIIGDGYNFTAGSTSSNTFTNSGIILAEAGSTFAAAGYDFLGIAFGGGTNFVADESFPFINTGTLSGSGTIANSNTLFGVDLPLNPFGFTQGDNLETDGIVAPGDSATETGSLTLNARDVIIGSSNEIQIDIGATGFDSVDIITGITEGLGGNPDITNDVELNGELSVNFLAGYTPQSGDSFQILTTNEGFVGTFDTETLPSMGGGLTISLDYGATVVTLEVGGIEGDYNLDGMVDAADYTLWRDSLGSTLNLAADGNQNGVVDSADYGVWASNYGQSIPAFSQAASQAVPEPSACVMLLTVMSFVNLRSRQA